MTRGFCAGRSRTTADLPKEMKRIVVKPGCNVKEAKVSVESVPMPVPKSGELLVKILAAPVNPSDEKYFIAGSDPNSVPKETLGLEGCGTVVATGGGLTTLGKMGKHVSVVVPDDVADAGTWAEYTTVPAETVAVLPSSVPVEDACSWFVNPFTAIAICDTAKKAGSPAFIHTAAASKLGTMLVKLADSEGVTIINVVRRKEQVESLKSLGAEHVVCTADAKWEEQLETLVEKLGVKVAFDCVGGDMPSKLLQVLPQDSTLFVYGCLDRSGRVGTGGFDMIDMVYRHKKVLSFFLTDWLRSGGLVRMILRYMSGAKKVVPNLHKNGWANTGNFKDCTPATLQATLLEMHEGGQVDAKLRIRFDR